MHSEKGSGCVGQMTSCIGISLLSCRAALLSVAEGGGGSFSSFCLYFFSVASGGSSHGRTSFVLCLGRATSTSERSPSLSQLERHGHVTSHPYRTSGRGARAIGWAGLSADLKSRSLLMRHTYPRARLRGEQVLSWDQHADVSRCVCAAT